MGALKVINGKAGRETEEAVKSADHHTGSQF